jgi:hypothetical protein
MAGTSRESGWCNQHKKVPIQLIRKRPKSRHEARWKDNVSNTIKKMGIVNWRKELQGRNGRRRAIGDVLNPLNAELNPI